MDPINSLPSQTIPLAMLYMRNGINVGGFQLRIYQYSPTWHIHLHLMGGVVSLRNNDQKVTYWIPLSNVECSEGFANEVSSSFDASPVPSSHKPVLSGALIPNQTAHKIPEVPVSAQLTAIDLGSTEPSAKEKAAKLAHMGHPAEATVQEQIAQETTKLINEHVAHDHSDDISPPAPVKKKRGRPRKVRPEEVSEAVSSSVSS